MDTNKENELMQNLERQTPGGDTHLPDGRPAKRGAVWATVNPSPKQPVQPSGASSQASQPSTDGMEGLSAIEQVTPEMINRMEAYGTEAVYDANKNH